MRTSLRALIPLVACAPAGCIVHGGGAPAAGGSSTPRAVATGGTPGVGFASGRGSAGLPIPPRGGMPRPSGAPGNVTVLDWARFKAAGTYTFDDTNSSQIQHYADLPALGLRMTFY